MADAKAVVAIVEGRTILKAGDIVPAPAFNIVLGNNHATNLPTTAYRFISATGQLLKNIGNRSMQPSIADTADPLRPSTWIEMIY